VTRVLSSRDGLRVLLVSSADVRGGAERVAWNLFSALRTQGHSAWLAVGDKHTEDTDVLVVPNDSERGSWSGFWRRIADRLGPAAHTSRAAAVAQRLAGGVADPGSRLDFYRGHEDFRFPGTRRLLELTPERPDLVHAHNLHGGYFDLRVLPWLSQQLPVILTLHDAWLVSGHCAHSFDCERWRMGCGHCPDLSIYPAVRRDATAHNWERKRAIFARSRLRVATPSHWLMEKVEASMLASGIVEARVIPNGVDLSVFRPGDKRAARAALGLPPEGPVLVTTAIAAERNPWKDFAALRIAIQTLVEQWQGPSIQVLVLGTDTRDGPSVDNPAIRFVPFQRDPAVIAAHYRAADVYVHSARTDTFPLAVIEALASGTPVVASAVGGIPEQVEDSRSGYLVPPGDAPALAAAVRRLLLDDGLRSSLGEEGARQAKRRFDLERQVDAYLDWYGELVEAGPREAAAA
jgi:glycosyltransferase involved in cell wall biosynthesis